MESKFGTFDCCNASIDCCTTLSLAASRADVASSRSNTAGRLTYMCRTTLEVHYSLISNPFLKKIIKENQVTSNKPIQHYCNLTNQCTSDCYTLLLASRNHNRSFSNVSVVTLYIAPISTKLGNSLKQ